MTYCIAAAEARVSSRASAWGEAMPLSSSQAGLLSTWRRVTRLRALRHHPSDRGGLRARLMRSKISSSPRSLPR